MNLPNIDVIYTAACKLNNLIDVIKQQLKT